MNIYSIKRFLKKIIPQSWQKKRIEKRDNKINIEKDNIKLIMCLLCKDEIDIIEDWLLFHKNMGVDGFIVTDNNSSDGTYKILQKYKEKGWILELIEEKEINYYQDVFCDKMIKLAKNKYHADYIISADTDEFWYSKSLNLKIDILKNKDCNIQKVDVKNLYPTHEKFNIRETQYFISNPLNEIDAKLYDINSAIFKPFINKVIFKAKDYKSIIGGNHNAVVKNRRECFSSTIIIYHYYIRNYNHFVDKISKGGKSMIQIENINKDNFWLYLYKNYYIKNKMKDAWDELFMPNKLNFMKENGIISIDKSISNYMDSIK